MSKTNDSKGEEKVLNKETEKKSKTKGGKEKPARQKKQAVAKNGNGKNGNNIQKYADQMHKLLQDKPSSVEQLSNDMDISRQVVFRVIQELINRGYRIIRDGAGNVKISSTEESGSPASFQQMWRSTTRILVWAGSQFGSIGQQADLVKTVYRTIIPEEKPDFVIALGDILVGNLSKVRLNETFLTEDPDFYKGVGKNVKFTELLHKRQIEYVANTIGADVLTTPHECKTYFVSGLREASFIKKGLIDPLAVICEKKSNWVYAGRNMKIFPVINTGEPVNILALTSKRSPFRGAYTRGHRPRKTADAIAGWLINSLRNNGVEGYPNIVLWTDGVGMYTSLHDIAAFHFVSLPKLSVTDPTDLELDTPPNLGVVIIDLTFDPDGKLKKHGIECKFRNLAPYVRPRGY